MDTYSTFTDFLLNKRFKLIENNNNLNMVKYELNGFYVKIVQERLKTGEMGYYIDLSRTNHKSWEGWYSMDVVRYLILQSHYILDRSIMFNELSCFFMEHYSDILHVFTSPDFSKAEAKMATLIDERGRAMFG